MKPLSILRILTLTLCLILSACGGLLTGDGSNPSTSVNTSPYTITYPAMPRDLESGRVSRIVDGDTFDVQVGSQTVRVRTIGMNTPESVDPRRPVQCFGKEAATRARELLNGQTVYLEIDPTSDTVDQYGRALRFVWLADGRLFNLQMIAEGYASEYTFQGIRYKYQSEFRAAQRTASDENRGLWSPSTCAGDFNYGVTR